MLSRRQILLSGTCAALIGVALVLQGCGDLPHCWKPDDKGGCAVCMPGYKPTGEQRECLYACETNHILQAHVNTSHKKGIMMDDTTHQYCADAIHSQWANTNSSVKSIRISKAWEADWNISRKVASWESIARFVKATGAVALVGTSLSCNETADDEAWQDVVQLLKMIGPNNVMGVAIGNEMELVWSQGASESCVKKLWEGGYILTKFNEYVNDLDELGPDWKSVNVTSVFGGFIFAGNATLGEAFVNDSSKAMVLPFLNSVLETHGDRFVFSLNNYPYFDTSNKLDEHLGDTCFNAIASNTCFDKADCSFNNIVTTMRKKMGNLTVRGKNASNSTLWITETGWSTPKASTLLWDPPKQQFFEMANCSEFSSVSAMKVFYENFLKWNLTIPGPLRGPDHVFYFGMRDSNNFGEEEYFGLVGGVGPYLCRNPWCKIQAIHDSGSTSSTGLVV